MNVNGTDANSLLAAQLGAQQRDASQNVASDRRGQNFQVDQVTNRRAAEATQTAFGVSAADTDNTGNQETIRRDLPRDAQQEARRATERNAGQIPARGSVFNVSV